MKAWDSDDRFGFAGASAGGNLGTATAPTPATAAASTLAPHSSAVKAILDPRGSAIFWLALAACLGLAMVSGQLAISAKLRARGGKK